MVPSVVVRPVSPHDDLSGLTALIHAAYAIHAQAGLAFWATRQSVEDTAKRFASGAGYVAQMNGELIGTVTVKGPHATSPVHAYRDPFTWTFLQFAVAPSHKGLGIGSILHNKVLEHVAARGGRTVTIDTAEPAIDLIKLYEGWSYRRIGTCDWRPHTNYLSVLLSRPVHLPI